MVKNFKGFQGIGHQAMKDSGVWGMETICLAYAQKTFPGRGQCVL